MNNSKSSLNDQQNLGSNLLNLISVNSIRNKFDLLMNIIKNDIDILVISETKIDSSFPISQFTMTGYSIPFRIDRTSHGGGILLFVRKEIPCKIIKTDCDAVSFCVIWPQLVMFLLVNMDLGQIKIKLINK